MKSPVFSLIVVCMLASLSLAVHAAPVTKGDFETQKSKSLAKLQEKLRILQEHIACVEAATDAAALKACHQSAKEQNKALKGHKKNK